MTDNRKPCDRLRVRKKSHHMKMQKGPRAKEGEECSSRSRNRQGDILPLEPLEGLWPYQHLTLAH